MGRNAFRAQRFYKQGSSEGKRQAPQAHAAPWQYRGLVASQNATHHPRETKCHHSWAQLPALREYSEIATVEENHEKDKSVG